MKLTKFALMLPVLSGVAFATIAKADLSLIDTDTKTPESNARILSVASAKLSDSHLINLARFDDKITTPAGSPFSIDYLTKGTAHISWNLADEDMALMGVYVFSGNRGANLYKVTDLDMVSGSATITSPQGKSGKSPDISRVVFLGAPAGAVPEPSSVILLGFGAAGFLGWCVRRR